MLTYNSIASIGEIVKSAVFAFDTSKELKSVIS